LRAELVETAEAWRWGSLWRRVHNVRQPLLSDWPVPEPRDWVKQVNQPQSEAELAALRRCLQRGSPFGGDAWTTRTAETLGLTSTLRPRGRAKLDPKD
jgi:putative transposase